ncbi:hypothetical protein KFE96_09250 [Kordiimonas sp. SCSIO 12603]|uniref:DUF6702 family protein n=1 Tax=Kordiimonas sp. SCSIO 12603 TaxID=2829596 RepID=UPI00210204CD|nr:DUF6702 family protein [Kordiimonas sp. SCSIO 12603]UTW57053.1 hypothetical protein KFE96_09250 [Kordiimonas sp. SCSIO 12603]
MRPILVSLFSIIFLLFGTQPATPHNVYTSFTRIDWNARDNSIEVVFEIFSHELEAKLSVMADRRMTFLDDNDYEALSAAIPSYIEENLLILGDGKVVPLSYLGFEMQDQMIYMYLEADLPEAPKKISVMNAVLLDDLPGQTNTVMAVVNGDKQTDDIREGTGPVTFEFN